MVRCIPFDLIKQSDLSGSRKDCDYVHTTVAAAGCEDDFISAGSFPPPRNQLLQRARVKREDDARVLYHCGNDLKPCKAHSSHEDAFTIGRLIANFENGRQQQGWEQDLWNFVRWGQQRGYYDNLLLA